MKNILDNLVNGILNAEINNPQEKKVGTKYITILERRLPIGFKIGENKENEYSILFSNSSKVFSLYVNSKKSTNNHIVKISNNLSISDIKRISEIHNFKVEIEDYTIYSVEPIQKIKK